MTLSPAGSVWGKTASPSPIKDPRKLFESFAEFGGLGRPKTAQSEKSDFEESPNPLIPLARREGFAREQSSLCESTAAAPAWGPVSARDSGVTMARREGFASQLCWRRKASRAGP